MEAQIPRGNGAILGVVPLLNCIRLCTVSSMYVIAARCCRVVSRGRRITAKVWLQNGLTRSDGD